MVDGWYSHPPLSSSGASMLVSPFASAASAALTPWFWEYERGWRAGTSSTFGGSTGLPHGAVARHLVSAPPPRHKHCALHAAKRAPTVATCHLNSTSFSLRAGATRANAVVPSVLVDSANIYSLWLTRLRAPFSILRFLARLPGVHATIAPSRFGASPASARAGPWFVRTNRANYAFCCALLHPSCADLLLDGRLRRLSVGQHVSSWAACEPQRDEPPGGTICCLRQC